MPTVRLGEVTIAACGGCCGEPGVRWSCESLTGTADLCGIGGYSADDAPYDPFFPEDWEGYLRKWAKRTLSGTIERFAGGCATCPGDSADSGFSYTYSGAWEVSCVANTAGLVTTTTYQIPDCTANPPAGTPVTELDTSQFTPLAACPADLEPYVAPVTEAYTLLTRTLEGCGCHTPNGTSYAETLGLASETLEDERNFYDALLEQDPDAVPGESCCTELSSAVSLDLGPRSIQPITLTGTAVRVPIEIVNGVDETTYTVTITLEQANDDPDPPTVWQVDIEVIAGTPVYFYPLLPIPGDYPICVTSVALAA